MLKTEYGYDWDWGGDMFQDTPAPATQHDRTNYGPSFIVGRGNLSQIARFDVNDPNNAGNTWQETKWRVNSTGSVLMERDHQWHQKFIAYGDSFSDGNNNRNTFAYPTTITDAGGFSSYLQYNFDFGANTRVQGPPPAGQSQGLIQTLTYDNAARLERVTTTNNNAYTRFVYGVNFVQSFATVNTVNDEAYTIQVFDGLGRVTSAAGNHPGSTGGYSAQLSVYDLMGRAIKQSNPAEINSSWVPAGDDAAGWLYTQQTYDWRARPRITTNTDGTTREASYGGCGCAGGAVVTLTDEGTIDGGVAKRRQQKIYSDVLGRTVKTEVLNWQGGSVYSSTVNTYNARDQITLIRQYAGPEGSGTFQDTIMTYDGRGRLKTRHVPQQNAGTVTTWDYNSDDTVLKITDARGASQTFTYNSRHLVTGITYAWPGGGSVPPPVSFGYDAAGNRTSMTDGTGSLTYDYNQISQLTSETRTFSALPGQSYTTSYDYWPSGQVKYLIDPAGSRVDYVYDHARRMTSAAGSGPHSAPSYASNLKYRAWGVLKDIDFGNATHQWVNYNARLQPINMELRNTYVSPSNPSVTLRWNYDYYADGLINHAYDVADDRMDRKLHYDHVGRLKEAYSGREARGLTPTNPADSPFRQSFGYDAFSNMSSRTGRFWRQTQLPESAAYTNDRRVGWTYDADGNVLADSSHENTFDAAGRQTWTLGPWNGCGRSYDIEQQYDGDGRPARRIETNRNEDYVGEPPEMNCTTNSETTFYVYASALGGVKLIELNASGTKAKGYVYGNGQRLAVQTVWPAGTDITYHHANPGTGSWAETNSDRSANRREMGPLGEELGTYDPYLILESPSYEDVHSGPRFIEGGDPFDMGSGCTLDGLSVPCSMARRALQNGAAAIETEATVRITYESHGVKWTETFTGRTTLPPGLRERFTGSEAVVAEAWFDFWKPNFGTAVRGALEAVLQSRLFTDGLSSPIGGFASFFASPQKSFSGCVNDARLGGLGFTEEAANLIQEINELEGTSRELLAVTWKNENTFRMRPGPNTKAGAANWMLWDVGPFHINIDWTLRGLKKKEISFAGLVRENVFGYSFYRSDGKTPVSEFDGSPLENGRMAARRLNAFGGSDEDKAAAYAPEYGRGHRRRDFQKYAKRFRDFYKCFKGK